MTTIDSRSLRPTARMRTAALLALLWALALGCKADTTGLGTLSVDDVGQLLARRSDVVLCDANTPKTRSRFGVIGGAQLLSSYRNYDLERELPADKARKLVFYCHSPFCSSAAEAARRAVAAGYQDVFLMPDGIKGWVEAGQPVTRPAAS